jgi:hypothetical protein
MARPRVRVRDRVIVRFTVRARSLLGLHLE